MEKYKVYIFPDMEAADLYFNNDLDGFREAIERMKNWKPLSM